MTPRNVRRPGRSTPGNTSRESGFATAEFAVATPAIVLVLAVILGALQAVSLHHRALHSASVGARLAARGEGQDRVVSAARRGGGDMAIALRRSDGMVTVQVKPEVPAVISWAVPDLSASVSTLIEEDLGESE